MKVIGRALSTLFAITLLGLAFNVLQPVDTLAQSDDSEPLLIEEFADLQCPACRYQHFMVKRLLDEFDGQIKVKYYHFPLQSHRYAMAAARATEAARNQGKFLEMKDLLFERQNKWPGEDATNYFLDYARELNLDIAQFKEDFNSQETYEKVMEDRNEGRRRGVRATPTFFFDGKMIEYPDSYAKLKSAVQSHLEQ
jgi:protein-disulfide isomerase